MTEIFFILKFIGGVLIVLVVGGLAGKLFKLDQEKDQNLNQNERIKRRNENH